MAMAVVPAGDVNAEDIEIGSTETEMQESAEYDLEKGGTQSFEMVDENGEETEIVVEEVPGIARVANGTYKISRNKKGNRTAGFYIDIKGNKGTMLSKDSNTQATLTLKFDGDIIEISKVRAKISNEKLVVQIS